MPATNKQPAPASNVVEISSGLGAKRERVIAALIASPSIKEAADVARVSDSTIWRYLKEDAFMEEYRAARRRIVEHAVVRLQHNADNAAGVLMSIAEDTTAPASARVSAARTVLERAMHTIDQDELQARIDRLEAHLKQKGEEPPPADEDEDE